MVTLVYFYLKCFCFQVHIPAAVCFSSRRFAEVHRIDVVHPLPQSKDLDSHLSFSYSTQDVVDFAWHCTS